MYLYEKLVDYFSLHIKVWLYIYIKHDYLLYSLILETFENETDT